MGNFLQFDKPWPIFLKIEEYEDKFRKSESYQKYLISLRNNKLLAKYHAFFDYFLSLRLQ